MITKIKNIVLKYLIKRKNTLTAFDNLVAKIKSEAVIMPFAKVNDSLKYIVDIETNKIVWMDEGLINKVGEDKTGELCFEVLQGCMHPCDFCTNHKLIRENEVIQWVHYNENHKRLYLVRDFMKIVDDRKLRYEMAIDITKHVNEIRNGC